MDVFGTYHPAAGSQTMARRMDFVDVVAAADRQHGNFSAADNVAEKFHLAGGKEAPGVAVRVNAPAVKITDLRLERRNEWLP